MEKLPPSGNESAGGTSKLNIPKMRNSFPDLVKTPGLLAAKQRAECVLVQAKSLGAGVSASAETLSRAMEIIRVSLAGKRST
jgi:hypothetical protein